MFYPIGDIEKDGYIHQDGSLRFEFSIMKNNFMKRAILEEKRSKNLRRLITCLSMKTTTTTTK